MLCGPGQSEVVDDLSEDELEEVWDMQGKYESVNLWGGPFLAFVDTLVYSVVESVPTEVHGILGFVNERLEFWGSAEGELASHVCTLCRGTRCLYRGTPPCVPRHIFCTTSCYSTPYLTHGTKNAPRYTLCHSTMLYRGMLCATSTLVPRRPTCVPWNTIITPWVIMCHGTICAMGVLMMSHGNI